VDLSAKVEYCEFDETKATEMFVCYPRQSMFTVGRLGSEPSANAQASWRVSDSQRLRLAIRG